MITWTRVVSASLVLALLAGPLAPVAGAQAVTAPPAVQQTAQQPQTGPDLFQETLKAERSSEADRGVYDAGAITTNIFLVPGRAITCLLGAATGLAVLGATLGTGYKAATLAVNEGCGGKWAVTGADLRTNPEDRYTYLEMERR